MPPLPCAPKVLVGTMRKARFHAVTGIFAALAACLGLLLALAGPAAAANSCAQMKAWLKAGGGASSGLLVVNAETEEVVCASGATKRLPLASNTKLFTTSTALAKLGPEARIPTKVLTD